MESVNLESKISHLYEVKANLKATITNLERVLKEQNSLISIIEEAENKHDLSDEMIEKLIADKQQIEKNLVELAEASACADTLTNAYETEKKENRNHSSMTTEAIFSLACYAFGLFRTSGVEETPTEAATEASAEELKDVEVVE